MTGLFAWICLTALSRDFFFYNCSQKITFAFVFKLAQCALFTCKCNQFTEYMSNGLGLYKKLWRDDFVSLAILDVCYTFGLSPFYGTYKSRQI